MEASFALAAVHKSSFASQASSCFPVFAVGIVPRDGETLTLSTPVGRVRAVRMND